MLRISTADNNGERADHPAAPIAAGSGGEYLLRLNKALLEQEDGRPTSGRSARPNRCRNVYAPYDCEGNARDRRPQPRSYKLAFRRASTSSSTAAAGRRRDQRPPGRSRAAAAWPSPCPGLPAAPVAVDLEPLPAGSPTVPHNRPRLHPGDK